MKTSKKDFERFKAAFLRWVEIFGLKEYEIIFEHRKLDGACAEVWANEKSKMAYVSLGIETTKADLARNSMEGLAKHEAIHLLLNRMRWLGECRYLNDSDLPEEWEKLVRVLEKAL